MLDSIYSRVEVGGDLKGLRFLMKLEGGNPITFLDIVSIFTSTL